MSVADDLKDQIEHPTKPFVGPDRPSRTRRAKMAAVIVGGLAITALLLGAGFALGYSAALS